MSVYLTLAKLKKLLCTGFLLTTPIVLNVSCDSGPLDYLPNSDKRAPIDTLLLEGELFDFEDVLNFSTTGEQLHDRLRVDDANTASDGQYEFTYLVLSEFTAQLLSTLPVEDTINSAWNDLLTIQTPANAEIRSLLEIDPTSAASVESPQLTTDQLARVVDMLNANGAGVFVNPNDPTEILAAPVRRYTITSTSSEAEKVDGVVGGTYSLELTSTVVDFRPITYQSLRPGDPPISYHVPFLTTEVLPETLFEQGRYTFERINGVGTP